MAKGVFLDKEIQPDDAMLSVALGQRKAYLEALLADLAETYAPLAQEWKYYGKAWGWSFVLKHKKKTLCYLTPVEGHFQASIIFNDKGRALAARAGLPEAIAQAVEASKDNPKNIPYDLDVLEKTDAEIAKTLIGIRAKT